ncbi:MAG: hypothetical protein LUC91_10935 [Prevotella sp.]|nr:hypothetical protein [Prevotella sp.]
MPVFLLIVLILMSHYSIKKSINVYVLFYLVGAIVPMYALENGAYLGYIKSFVAILPLLWIYLSLRKSVGTSAYLSIFLKYSNLMVVLAVISLIMWLLCSLMHIIPPTARMPYEWAPNKFFIPSYYGIYFETQSIAPFGVKLCRNTGIFNEGPMYNMALCSALILECFIRPVKSKFKISILAITVFSTLTTTGQFFLLFLCGWYLYKKIIKQRVLLIFMIPLLLYGAFIGGSALMTNKIESGGYGSVNSRSNDIQRCIEIGFEHPLVGVGLVTKERLGGLSGIGKEVGYSNSLFTVFARGGVYSLLLYIGGLLFIPYRYSRKYKDYHWFIAMLCFFLIFTITISYLKYLTLLFLAWGLSNINMVKWKDDEET